MTVALRVSNGATLVTLKPAVITVLQAEFARLCANARANQCQPRRQLILTGYHWYSPCVILKRGRGGGGAQTKKGLGYFYLSP